MEDRYKLNLRIYGITQEVKMTDKEEFVSKTVYSLQDYGFVLDGRQSMKVTKIC